MKNFARVGSSAQTGQSHGAGNNGDKAVAAIPGCAIGLSGRLPCGLRRLCLGPHLENINAMFDSENPVRSGGLAGASFATTLESNSRYPSLRSGRHRALFELLDDIVADHLSRIAPHLRGLGFDESGIVNYRAAALSVFRAARPNKHREN